MAKAHAYNQAPHNPDHVKPAKAGAANDRSSHGNHGKGSHIKSGHGKSSRPAPQKLILPPQSDWHTAELPDIPTDPSSQSVPVHLLDNIHEYAKSLLEADASTYTSTHLQSSSSYKFMSTIMSSGTWSDKVSALTLVVQESPLHALKPFDNLVALAGKRSRTQALMALEALKDMLSQGNVLPPDRKLRMFTKQPGLLAALQKARPTWNSEDPLPAPLTHAHLVFWAYEDYLKAKYFEILRILESWCNDEVEFARLRAVTFVWELLKERPEQEENLLRLLVNKLGDTSKKVASRASHLLLQLQVTHPSMKSIVINAIESDILLRPGQNLHAKYYAVITLNQTVLQTSDPEAATRLLDVYFNLFVTILNRSNKAGSAQPKAEEEVNGTAKKRKRSASHAQGSDRPEQELEDKIVAQVLTGINRAFPFSGKDSDIFEKHLDTMFKITHSANFNTSIQALMLIQQISAAHNISTDRFLRTLYESLLDPRLLRSSKHTMYLNLLYRSLKSDVSVRRVKAFVKRLLQIMELHEPPFVCALLYLIIELQNLFPGVKAMLEQPEAHDEDEEEAFVDMPDDTDAVQAQEIGQQPKPTKQPSERPTGYDGRKRDPEHSNAEKTCLWELSPWTHHYHPSVTLFAAHLASPHRSHHASSASAPPKPDPAAHSLIHFLDRFVYRKPKSKPDSALRGSSLMQPALASSNTADTLVASGRRADGSGAVALNSEGFWAKRVEDVAPDEVFFHRYFAEVGPKRKAGKKSGAEPVDGGDGEFGEEDEEEIWKALVGSRDADGEDGDGADGESDEEDDEMFDYDDDQDDDDDEEQGEGGVELEGDLDELDLDDEVVEGEDGENDEVELNLEDDDSSAMFSSEEEEGAGPIPAVPQPQDESVSGSKAKRRKLRNLPTFASADDYAALIDGGDEDADSGD